MATDFNSVTLVGRLTRDAELRAMPGGTFALSYCIAVNRQWKDKNGEKREEASFFDVQGYGPGMDVLAPSLVKGRRVLVNGRLTQERWEKDGQKRTAVRVIHQTMQFLDHREERPADAADTGEQPVESTINPDDIPF